LPYDACVEAFEAAQADPAIGSPKYMLSSTCAHDSALLRISKQSAKRSSERVHIAWWDQQPGLFVDYRLRNATACTRNHWQSASHSFQVHEPGPSFVTRGGGKDVRARELFGKILPGNEAWQIQEVSASTVQGRRTQIVDELLVTLTKHPQMHVRIFTEQAAAGFNEHVNALGTVDSSNEDDGWPAPFAPRARAKQGRVDTSVDYGNPLRVEPVVFGAPLH